ncbi:TRAP transporter substrate-binding protein [Psychromarinibacter halotolerans]|uniref:TRAP transporter substrate-binding protein n=1 Tax=Psychromarinibacter halotolerans TaxID=1775175 RepID=A0ABV7GN07_9RHOB|nr:TRAP transporter substrate-binding protein [Psychromarinibacter halotolerans]MDF0595671.1 TRAP transporter substrate-binding protein [Psychromarinibacter halotolerans]
MKLGLKTAFLASTLLVAAPLAAQEQLKATWTDPDDPTTAPVTAYMHVLESQVERNTGDAYDIELYPNGQLGDQRAMVQQVSRGSLHFANIASGVLASLGYPQLGIVDMPFLFKSRAHFNASMNRDNPFIAKLMDDVAAETGIRIISLHPYGFRNMTTKDTAVETPEDMAGLRMRTMEVVPHQKMMEALGATPVPIPYLELYTSLQTGVVDGQENPPSNIILQRFYQVQGHMTETQHVMTVGAVITNEEWWQGLSEEDRTAILAADAEASLAHDGIGAVNDLLGVQTIRDEGVEVHSLGPDQLEAFRAATIEPTKAWAVEQFGEEFVNGFFEHMADYDARF